MSIGSGQWTKMNLLFFFALPFFRFFLNTETIVLVHYIYMDGNRPEFLVEEARCDCMCVSMRERQLKRSTKMYCQISGTNENIGASAETTRSFHFVCILWICSSFYSLLLTSLASDFIWKKRHHEYKKNSKNKEVAANLLNKRKTKCNKIKSTQHQQNMT